MGRKRWVQKGENHVLYFTSFYDTEKKLAEVFYEDDDGWCFSSKTLDTHDEYLGSDSLQGAKEDVEALIQEHYEDQRNYYAHLAEAFRGGQDATAETHP